MNVYEQVVFVFSCAALIGFVMVLLEPQLLNYFFTYKYYEFTSKSLIFLNVITSELGFLKRNAGFASEPGLYQYVINLALWWRLRKYRKIDLYSSVFIMSIITTNSTVGLLCMILILFFSSLGRNKFFILALFLLLTPLYLDSLYYHLEYKLIGSDSFNGRSAPFFNAFSYSFEKPLGIGSIEYMALYKDLEIGGWDSFSQLVLRYGYQGLFFVCFFLAMIFRREKILACIIFLSFTAQSIWFYPIVSCFYFWALDKEKLNIPRF